MRDSFYKKARDILTKFGIKTNDIKTKEEICKSKSFIATLITKNNK